METMFIVRVQSLLQHIFPESTGKTSCHSTGHDMADFEVETEARPRTAEFCLEACLELSQLVEHYITGFRGPATDNNRVLYVFCESYPVYSQISIMATKIGWRLADN